MRPVENWNFSPQMTATNKLSAGSVGYIATGLKTISECRVGDTITLKENAAQEALPGYQKSKTYGLRWDISC